MKVHTTIFLFWLVLSIGVTWVSITMGTMLVEQVFLYSKPEVVTRTVLIAQAALLIIIGAIASQLVSAAYKSSVVRPIKKIIEAVEASTNNQPIPMLDMSGASSHIATLGKLFLLFSQKVNDAHTHDQDASRVKSDFISTAAHQLRTPLTGIRWALEALEKEPLPESQMVLVQSAVSKSKDLVSVVGTLLDISSIESGKYKYTFASTDMPQLVQKVTSDFVHLATDASVALRYDSPVEPVPLVHADADRITWVLNNLIENAVRYTPAGGSVVVSVERNIDRVFVKVRDTGIGIGNEDKNNIFERFYRAGNAIAKENKGSGLGLYIARTIATDHGGDLTFSANKNGPGTTFLLALPIVG